MSPKARILVVDDVADNRRILSRPLLREGFCITEAENGAAALDQIEGTGLDLVFLDIAMPGLDGFEVLRRIRAKRQAAELPVIMVTARAQAEDIVTAFELGANDYVTKPIDLRVIVARAESHLSRSSAEKRLRDACAEITTLNFELRQECARRAEAEALALDVAHHDALTGVFNRRRFMENVAAAITSARADRPLCLLCLDLDGFKPVNDQFGHSAGDETLRAVADRLRGCVQEAGCVGRLGGDEFAILLPCVRHPREAQQLAQGIIRVLSMPFFVCQSEVRIGCSVGIAWASSTDMEPHRLLSHADSALYVAKAAGRGTWRQAEDPTTA